jgi:hypothetical protein
MEKTKDKRGGRKPGTQNRLTKDMKEIIHLAFSRAGGVDYLVEQARSEPKAFMGLLGRIVPNEVRLDVLVALDLGSAMLENERNLQRLNSVTIDNEPDKPTNVLITKEK